MNRFGYSAATFRSIIAAMADPQRVKVRVKLLDLEHHHLADLTGQFTDGQINWANREIVTRRATIVLNDPRRALPFDTDAPADGALWYNRMLRVVYAIRVAGDWVELVPFTGPVVHLARDGHTVTATCDGKERLALSQCWAPLHLDKGMRKTDAIRRILSRRAGETRFDIPDLSATLPHPVTLGPDDQPWVVARRLARSMDRQLFYDGRGVCVLRRHPGHSSFTFTGGKHVLSEPKLEVPADFVNAVRVVGALPKGAKQRVHWQAVASGKLSPANLGRTLGDGTVVPRHQMPNGQTIRDDKIKTRAEAKARAERELADALQQPVSVTFDALPGLGAFMDPGDRMRVSIVDTGVVTFRLDEASMPLGTGQAMSVGYLDHRLSHHNPRHPRHHHRRHPRKHR